MKRLLPLALVVLGLGFSACKPKTLSQKIEDKSEDAAHEVHQGAERATENANNAVK